LRLPVVTAGIVSVEIPVVPSTVIKSFSYDESTKKLTIVFWTGRIYHYLKVPKEVYSDMKAAFAKGKFYNEHIKYNYDFEEANGLQISQ
jgi:hypothetical protein